MTCFIFKWGMFAMDFFMILLFVTALLLVITEWWNLQMTYHIFKCGMFARDFFYALTLCQNWGVGCYRTVRLVNDLCHFQMGNVCNGHFVWLYSLLQRFVVCHYRTVKLSNDLSHFEMGNDNMYLTKLTMNIFQKYLDSYIR